MGWFKHSVEVEDKYPAYSFMKVDYSRMYGTHDIREYYYKKRAPTWVEVYMEVNCVL